MPEPVNGRRQYRSGARFERQVQTHLHLNGYYAVRTPGSKGAADVVAIKAGQVLLVQAKTDGRCDPEPWNALYDLAEALGAVPLLAARPRPGAVEYWRLLRRKDGGGRQPKTLFTVDEAGEAR